MTGVSGEGRSLVQAADTLRVVTLNLLHDPASWPARAALVEAELLALAPDVALFQEVAWPEEQATALATALGRQTGWSYAAHLTAVLVPGRWRGALAILSRFPIQAADDPGIAGSIHVCQRVRLDVAGRALDVYNLHLDPFAPQLHHAQLAALLTVVDGYPDAAGVVLGGDLNALPTSEAVQLVTGRLRSVHVAAHGREPEHTSPTPFSARRSRPSRPATYRTVDYLFVSPHLGVVQAGLAFTSPADHDPTLYPSDHYGLMADLTWTG